MRYRDRVVVNKRIGLIGGLILIALLLIAETVFAKECKVTQIRFNYITKKIYEVSVKHEYKVFENLEKAQNYAQKKGVENNILKDKVTGIYQVFLTVPKDSCVSITETN